MSIRWLLAVVYAVGEGGDLGTTWAALHGGRFSEAGPLQHLGSGMWAAKVVAAVVVLALTLRLPRPDATLAVVAGIAVAAPVVNGIRMAGWA